jgi:gas vesicle protein
MNKGTKNAVLGFLFGAAAGALAGVLIAPQKGSKTRKQIQKKVMDMSREMTDTITEKVDDLKDQVKEMVGKVKEKVNKINEDGESLKKRPRPAAFSLN